MGKPDEDIVEKAFVVRSYGKGELASMYIDGNFSAFYVLFL